MTTILVRRGTQTQLDGISLTSGELGYTTDNDMLSVGDGTSNFMVGRTLAGTDAAKPASGWIAGRLYFATDTEKLYRDTGSAWTEMDVVPDGSIDLADMADIATDTFIGRANAAGTGVPQALTKTQAQAVLNVTDGADVTNATTVNAAGATMNTDTDVSGNDWVIDEDNLVSNLATKVPTQQSVKAYVDGVVASGIVYKGAYDASANSPDLDTAPSGVSKGDMYTVTTVGTFFTIDLEIGDVLIAEADDATTAAEWTIVQGNIDFDAATIKSLYESNSDTNAFTDSDETIVDAALVDGDFTAQTSGFLKKSSAGVYTVDNSTYQSSLTFGIADTNALKVDDALVADDDFARFTTTGIEGRTAAQVLTDIGAAAMSHDLVTHDTTVTGPQLNTMYSNTHAESHDIASHDTTVTGTQLNAMYLDTHAEVHDLASHDTTVTGTQLNTMYTNSHAESHDIASHDTTATGTELNTLTDGSNADSLHNHSLAGTNISVTENAGDVALYSSTGTDDTIAIATQALCGVLSPTDKTKLDSITLGVADNNVVTVDGTIATNEIAVWTAAGLDGTDTIDGGTFV